MFVSLFVFFLRPCCWTHLPHHGLAVWSSGDSFLSYKTTKLTGGVWDDLIEAETIIPNNNHNKIWCCIPHFVGCSPWTLTSCFHSLDFHLLLHIWRYSAILFGEKIDVMKKKLIRRTVETKGFRGRDRNRRTERTEKDFLSWGFRVSGSHLGSNKVWRQSAESIFTLQRRERPNMLFVYFMFFCYFHYRW